MTRPVRLLFFTQTLGCERACRRGRFSTSCRCCPDKIAIEEVNFVLEPDQAAQYGIDRVPAIAVVGQRRGRRRARLAHPLSRPPAGYEFMSLVQAVLLVGGGAIEAVGRRAARLAAVDEPVTMQVFTTPT